jgi:hypothetical protein
MSLLCVFNRTRDSFLGLNVVRATNVFARLPRPASLASRQDGIWLAPSTPIHTLGRTSAIDAVYLDEANRVLHVVEHMKPLPLVVFASPCRSVLELPARTIFASGTEPGDQLLICRPEDLEDSVGGGRLAA